MNGNKVVLDTNVIINHLAGDKSIEAVLEGTSIYISSITFAELLAGNLPEEEGLQLEAYLKEVHIIHTNNFICEFAAALKKNYANQAA